MSKYNFKERIRYPIPINPSKEPPLSRNLKIFLEEQKQKRLSESEPKIKTLPLDTPTTPPPKSFVEQILEEIKENKEETEELYRR